MAPPARMKARRDGTSSSSPSCGRKARDDVSDSSSTSSYYSHYETDEDMYSMSTELETGSYYSSTDTSGTFDSTSSSSATYDRRTSAGWSPDQFVRLLGKGHFGTVYLSYCDAKRRHFAVKCANSSKTSVIQSMKREAEILLNLDSDYVIKCLGYRIAPKSRKTNETSRRSSKSDGIMHRTSTIAEIYLPYMKINLKQFVRRIGGKVDVHDIRTFATHILEGIKYIHSEGLVHRDIKGSNILVGRNHLKLADFGVAKHIHHLETKKRRGLVSRAGTKAWMAPEVTAKKEQGFASDIWSFGCTVVEMITGESPRAPNSARLIHFLMSTPRGYDQAISLEIQNDLNVSVQCLQFLGKCFSRDPNARWTAEQLLHHPFLRSMTHE